MASTARHRASTAPLTWAARSLVTATTVPVGALAGCVVAAVAATAQNPVLGVAGLAAAGVPLTLSGLRARHRARSGRVRGRHVAGFEQLWPAAPIDARTASGDDVLVLHDDDALVRLDPAVDAAAPSPAAFRALAVAPVARAEATLTGPAAAAAILPALIPAPRSAAEAEADHQDDGDDDERVAAVADTRHLDVVVGRPEVLVRIGAQDGEVEVHVSSPTSLVAPEQRALEIAQLQRLWSVGTGPDTGSFRATAPAA
ncbi:hypothetical protein SAMN06264364_11355 [Quadrisphaera granulorum]|uniref:Uncharacterized protein n=1 Tax=Quadrisphaera granulorum TaxID=317664 RepID=A0A316AT51_9ACTN|nr:hypothetical protein [Quadrisphaera granulorum]PWJ53297.1 hypothetical protein BXY45_11355 [Quadrisphaera granulorum]SZE96971.1 hypothetical protein SAMN06264364_11355 [Quadrisphaera granulorum]